MSDRLFDPSLIFIYVFTILLLPHFLQYFEH